MAPHPSMAKGMIPHNVEICRTDKRLSWTKEEDKRPFSAWLNNSNDPIAGNCKKANRYWQDVTATYNSTTPKNRKREMNQVKDRFHRVNKKVGWFAASWQKDTGIYASGQSDLQLQEKALKFYEEDYKQGQFKYMHCWKAVEGWPKWETYMQMLQKLKKRKASEIVEPLEELDSDEDISRPPGNKTAKTE
ncbi:hypothetical protein ZWY2020_048360 [Hordeum vulgare]|nr:hypothetical protein ZWY2020_048360 [Hordeum vulgare]